MLTCPFCGAPETDRFDLEGRRFLVFRCLFTPQVDPLLSDEQLRAHLKNDYRPDGSGAYFRRMCDRLHYYVTAGPGGQALKGAPAPASPSSERPTDR